MKFLPTPATVTTYTDTGLTNGQIYYYKVCAYSSAGNSTMSDTLDATPSSGVVGNNTLFYVGIAAIVLVFVAGVSVAIWNARR
jgi:hypothetical protein